MKTDQASNQFSRRQFLATAALAVAAPAILPPSVFGQAGKPAPSNRITLGTIGCGWQGGSNLGAFLRETDCQFVAVCDVDKAHLSNAVWNTCTKYRLNLKYPDNIEMVIAGGYPDIKSSTKWIGTDGWVQVTRSAFSASNEAWTEMTSLPDEQRKVKLYDSRGHMRNFLDCVKSRKPTITPIETAHHSTVPGHLGLIAMWTGRKLRWDAQREIIVGDTEASKLLGREYRKPWSLQ